MTTQLLPASRFSVRKFDSKRNQIIYKGNEEGITVTVCKKYGIWDHVANAWVSLNSKSRNTDGFEYFVPTSYSKSTAKAAIANGLYDGYQLVEDYHLVKFMGK